ncbi:unnamed protein product [Owenia fusiformis]|uniref:Uncharacterized protein n=1 Tax=Owenia fusiformis TaxID=6347 RepID=A0A8S4MYR6_OWEFU|nr:unnamed protein product [Owenia fusiformis]
MRRSLFFQTPPSLGQCCRMVSYIVIVWTILLVTASNCKAQISCDPRTFYDCKLTPIDCISNTDCKNKWLGTEGYETSQCSPSDHKGLSCIFWCELAFLFIGEYPSLCKQANGGIF